uniref:Uncharacterized protein n=1 Tax=Sphaeramia orbicularis TaxID=375764 RepID=A0A672ZAN1_9TELE
MDVLREAENKPLSKLSSFSYIPPRRKEPKEMSYFNRETEVYMYDQVFHQAEGYDMRLHRDDRGHSKGRGLNIYEEVKTTPLEYLPCPEHIHPHM